MSSTKMEHDRIENLLREIKRRANVITESPFVQKEAINDIVNALSKVFREQEYAIRQTSEDTYIIKIEISTDSMIDLDDIEKIQREVKKTLGNFDVSFLGVSPNGDESLILSFWTFEL